MCYDNTRTNRNNNDVFRSLVDNRVDNGILVDNTSCANNFLDNAVYASNADLYFDTNTDTDHVGANDHVVANNHVGVNNHAANNNNNFANTKACRRNERRFVGSSCSRIDCVRSSWRCRHNPRLQAAARQQHACDSDSYKNRHPCRHNHLRVGARPAT